MLPPQVVVETYRLVWRDGYDRESLSLCLS